MKHGYWNRIVEAKGLLDKERVSEIGRIMYMSKDVYDDVAKEVGLPIDIYSGHKLLGIDIRVLDTKSKGEDYIQLTWQGGSTYD